VDEFAHAIDRRPAALLLEIDAIGTSSCVARVGSLPLWEADLRYEIDRVSALPHTVVYVEGGYSDSNSVSFTADACACGCGPPSGNSSGCGGGPPGGVFWPARAI